ncbi:MAG: phosphoribosylformylglycinamidine synthase subunit PurS [Armatimonadetes bacterium]|nr:phosphoribosylformylglycinamidine synthase subunit PurS [Armatimonadota bacterium]
MPKVKVYIKLKPTVLDAQGQVIQNALHSLGYENLEQVRAGKYFELEIAHTDRSIEEEVRGMCDQLLVNPVMEDYTFEVVGGEGKFDTPAEVAQGTPS